MKRLALTIVVVLGLVLVACAPPTPKVVEVTKIVEIPPPLIVVSAWAGAEVEPFLATLKAFEEKTGIKVNHRTYREELMTTILPAAFEAKEPFADLMLNAWGWWVSEKYEHLVDLSDLAEGIPFTIDPAMAEEKVYGIPYLMWVKPGFWYRKSFFEEHGLEEPTTWDEFMDLLDKIKEIPGVENPIVTGDAIGWPISDVTEHFIATFGGAEVFTGLVEGTVKWTDPEVRAIFEERIVPLLEGDYFSDPIEWTSALEMWWNGEYGLYYIGNWITGMVEDPADLGLFTLPGAEIVTGGSDYAFIPKYTDRVEDAKKLLEFLISEEGMNIRAGLGGKLSSRRDTPVDVYPPAEAALVEAVGKLTFMPDLDDTVGGDFQATFWDQLKLLWVSPETLDDVLTAFDEAMAEMLE